MCVILIHNMHPMGSVTKKRKNTEVRKMKKLTAILLAAILAAALLCGCGSTDTAGNQAAGAASSDTSADVKVIRLAASDPASYPLCQ